MPLTITSTLPEATAVAVERFETPAGRYIAAWIDDKLVYGITGPDAEPHFTRWRGKHGYAEAPAKPRLAARMKAYFAGKDDPFDGLTVGFVGGTPFQQAVWRALGGIPAGTVTTYGALAAKIRRPGSGRPVGQAVGANPVTIVLPCHRVVGSTGALTGFGCGLPVKRILLAAEGIEVRNDAVPQ